MAACGQALRRFIADYGAGPIRCGRRRICSGAGQGPPAAFRCRRTWPCGDSLQSLAIPGRHCASVPTLRTKPGCLSEPAFDNRADRSEPDSSTSLLADSYVRVGRQWAALMAAHDKYLKFLLATCGHIPMAADIYGSCRNPPRRTLYTSARRLRRTRWFPRPYAYANHGPRTPDRLR